MPRPAKQKDDSAQFLDVYKLGQAVLQAVAASGLKLPRAPMARRKLPAVVDTPPTGRKKPGRKPGPRRPFTSEPGTSLEQQHS